MEAPGEEGFVELNGLRFHYVWWGNRCLPPIVCLHGLRSYGRTFAPLAATLSDHYCVIALDQRGRGETEWDPARNYYTDQYVADLGAFVDYLGLGQFHLLGHSMGGINAIVFSGTYPERLRSLILEDSGPGASTGSPGATRINAELARTPATFPDWAAARAFWRSIRPNVTSEAISSRMANSMRQTPGGIEWKHDQAGITACRLRPDPARVTPDLWPYLESIRCRGLIVRGGNSDYLSAETLAAMLARNPRLLGGEIPEAGHYVHDDQPAAFNRSVGAFLAAVEHHP